MRAAGWGGMDAASLLRLVAESTRHAILAQLREGEKTVTAMVAAVGQEQSNVSHHLGLLREAGLVSSRRRGREQWYRLSDPEVARLLEQVESLAARLDQVAYSSSLGLPAQPGFHGYG